LQKKKKKKIDAIFPQNRNISNGARFGVIWILLLGLVWTH
jgi:hypothetical protein